MNLTLTFNDLNQEKTFLNKTTGSIFFEKYRLDFESTKENNYFSQKTKFSIFLLAYSLLYLFSSFHEFKKVNSNTNLAKKVI